MSRRALVIVVALLAASAARADGPAGVAVMPFKNLNADASLAWLTQGMAETMISDLKKLGRTVVERDQLDRALAEIALAGSGQTEDATAAQAGKLVGAKTVVVGGFQKAGDELRITARFVQVETGVVEGTAKATGKIERVFDLQDEIVRKLAGRPATRKKSKGKATVDAYRLYAMSLATSSEVERVKYLRESIATDADFSYAIADLAQLEARMRRYSRTDRDVRDEVSDETRRRLASADLSAMDRYTTAIQLLSGDMTAFRWRKLLDDCAFVEKIDVAPPMQGAMSVVEMCSQYKMIAYLQLKRSDEALRQGEQHLAKYPGSQSFYGVKMQLQGEIDQRRRRAESVQKYDAELAEIEDNRREGLARRSPDVPEVNRRADFQRCAQAYSHAAYARALDECAKYLTAHREGPNPYEANELARFYIMMAKAERGDFAGARAEGERLLDDSAPFAQKMSLAMIMSTWPRD